MEEERLQKKLDKILEWRLLRKRLRKMLMQTAADEDLLETVRLISPSSGSVVSFSHVHTHFITPNSPPVL